MTKSEKIVAIARDVIKQLNRRKNPIQATKNVLYISSNYRIDPTEVDGDLKDCADKVRESGCSVCALGAALISKARLFDNVPLSACNTVRWYGDGEPRYRIYFGPERTYESLADIFTGSQLSMIESAYEISDMRENIRGNANIYGAVVFGSKFKIPKTRLIAIMKNIIENNGRFVPPKATKKEFENVC